MREHVWFEMRDIRKRRLSNAVWIPLRADETSVVGESGHLGFEEDFFGLGSVAFPAKHRQRAESLDWSDIGLSHESGSEALADG